MSLDYSFKNIDGYEELCYEGDDLSPVTKALVFATMSTHIGEITEKSYEEFYARLHTFEKLHGPFVSYSDGPKHITLDQVKAHIGLKTNVFPEKTRNQWLKDVIGYDVDRFLSAAKRGW
jgi:hypothetical protein